MPSAASWRRATGWIRSRSSRDARSLLAVGLHDLLHRLARSQTGVPPWGEEPVLENPVSPRVDVVEGRDQVGARGARVLEALIKIAVRTIEVVRAEHGVQGIEHGGPHGVREVGESGTTVIDQGDSIAAHVSCAGVFDPARRPLQRRMPIGLSIQLGGHAAFEEGCQSLVPARGGMFAVGHIPEMGELVVELP